MKRLIKHVVVGACAFMLACGGGPKTDTTPPKNGENVNKGPTTVDKVYKYEGFKLAGMTFAPQALGRPALPKVSPPRRTTLKRAARFARFKNTKKWPKVGRVDAVLIYVSMLWHGNPKIKPDKAKRAAQRETARKLLEKLYAVPHDAKSHNLEVVMQMVYGARLAAKDTAGALKAMKEHIATFPESKATPYTRAWAAFYSLRADDNAGAAEFVEAGVPAGRRGHYVKAWVAFRQRKFDEARKSIAEAAKAWRGRKRIIRHETMLIMGRSGASVDEADALIKVLAPGNPPLRYRLLYTLQTAYGLTGAYTNALKVLDMLATSVVGKVPVNDLVSFRLSQAALYYQVNDPAKSVEAALAAQKGLGPCGNKCAQLKNPVLGSISNLALVFHTIFASSLDDRYHSASVKLYDAYLAIQPPRPDKGNVERFYESLKQTKKNTAKGAGFHNNPKALNNILESRRPGIQGCYESVLQGDRSVAGVVKATIQFDEKGTVTGVETDPAKGVAGLAAVAGCIDTHVRGWVLPSRTVPGKTVLVVPYKFVYYGVPPDCKGGKLCGKSCVAPEKTCDK